MVDDLRHAVEALPPLAEQDSLRVRTRCKICNGSSVFFDYVDFNKFCSETNPYEFGYSGVDVEYLRCEDCGLIFTTCFDKWSNEDWKRFIYNKDYIRVDSDYATARPLQVAVDFARRLRGLEQGRILDYGSGSGVFADRMRDHGFMNVTCYDPFSNPERPHGLFDIITCFEVIEHSPDPLGTLRDMTELLADGGCILFSQTLQPDDILARRGGWWYLAPRNGHVSTYADETLVSMGRILGLRLYRGDTVLGYAYRHLSSSAQLVLASIGPCFEVVRLYAPSTPSNSSIAFPDRTNVWWHKIEGDKRRRIRWTARRTLAWRVRWHDASLLQVRIPFTAEARPNFANECTLTLDGVTTPTRLSRGEIAAEFEVDDRGKGTIEFNMPEPMVDPTLQRKVGLAVELRPRTLSERPQE